MNNQKKGMIYITISVLVLLIGWLLVYIYGVPLRYSAMYIKGGDEIMAGILVITQTLGIDFIALLIGIHGLLLLHSEKK